LHAHLPAAKQIGHCGNRFTAVPAATAYGHNQVSKIQGGPAGFAIIFFHTHGSVWLFICLQTGISQEFPSCHRVRRASPQNVQKKLQIRAFSENA
jgi:hypothetical protein